MIYSNAAAPNAETDVLTMPYSASPPLWLTLRAGGGDSTRGGLAHPRGLRREANRCQGASLGEDLGATSRRIGPFMIGLTRCENKDR